MKQEIILIIHSLAVGGAERRLSTFANYASDKGYDITILLIDNPTVKFELSPNIRVVCVNQNPDLTCYDDTKCTLFKIDKPVETSFKDKMNLHKARIFDKKEAEYLESENWVRNNYAVPVHEYIKSYPDAIVASFMTFPNLALMMAAKDLPNRCLFGDCCDAEAEFPADSPYHIMRKKFYGRADAAIFQTPDEHDYYAFLPDLKYDIIPNFIKSDNLPERFTGERRKDIVDFCRLSVQKDVALLISAFSFIHKDFPDYTLSIYGEGPEKDSLLKQINELNLDGFIKIYDFDLKVHNIVCDAAMYVSSSYREGISNSMLEAMAIGMPCVCTDCAGGGARMMIKDHINGLLVPMHDADGLYRAMKEIIENPDLSESLSAEAVKIKEDLKPEVICSRMLDAILGKSNSKDGVYE